MTWTAKKGKYIHEDGCGAGPDEPCTCEPPYPQPNDRELRAIEEREYAEDDFERLEESHHDGGMLRALGWI